MRIRKIKKQHLAHVCACYDLLGSLLMGRLSMLARFCSGDVGRVRGGDIAGGEMDVGDAMSCFDVYGVC